jgi:serine/threonine-protein kinase
MSEAMTSGPVNPGDVLMGKYRVDRFLGMGAMGVVVAATHLGLDQRVALKFMLPGKGAQSERLERFLREARSAVRLKSQHVAKVLDVGTHESGAPYMVMEFLEGCDLAALLERRGTLPIEEAVEYVLQTCEAVGEAHAAGIVHRDLKPANLFLTTRAGGSPCIKVLDFGVSKHQGSELKLTNEREALGSPLYMSAEQMMSSKNVDARSDLWALGVILYELIAGKTPFHAEQLPQLCARIFHGAPTPLANFRPDAPAGLEAVIFQCLQKDRTRRWSNAAELAAALVPYAPLRARVYAERVAEVLGLQVEPARLTAVLPPAPVQTAALSVAQSLGGVTASAALVPPSKELGTKRGRGVAVVAIMAVATLGLLVAGVGIARWRAREAPAESPAAMPTTDASPPPSAAPTVSTAEAAPSVVPALPSATSAAPSANVVAPGQQAPRQAPPKKQTPAPPTAPTKAGTPPPKGSILDKD